MSALAKKKEQLNSLLLEVQRGQEKLDAAAKDAGVKIEQSEIDSIHAKAREAVQMQEEVDRYDLTARIAAKADEIENPRTPGDPKTVRERKRLRMTAGQAFAASKRADEFRKSGKMDGWSSPFVMRGSMYDGMVEVTPEEAKDFDPVLTPLAVIGEDTLIQPMRDPELVRFEERRQPSLRDLLNVSGTGANSIEWIRISAVNRAAAIVAATELKPYMNLVTEKKSTSVKTLAVLAKVTEQQLEDAPQLTNLLDVEMRADIKLQEEEQVLWGDGAGDNFDGLFLDPLVVPFARGQVGDTLIDTIRRMRTDIRLRRLSPSGVLVHPLDWETIELEKGSDDRYVWAVIMTPLGPRIWGMPVVESESAENPSTGQRLAVVADWKRGATLWDRHEIRALVGFVGDDFARNLRTMRAEERLAFGVKRPHAFTYHETAAGSPGSPS